MSGFIQEFIDRRVLQVIGAYAAGVWVLIEILERMIDRYLWSPHLSEFVFWGLYSLMPAIALIAWTHGKPGKDKITRGEIIGIPINLIATLGLLINLASGKDLGSTAEVVEVANEYGDTETHYIPKDNFRRRLAVFFWENESGNADYDWLQYGMAHLLAQDLSQNPYMLVNSPFGGWANGYYSRMQRAGYDNGLGLPLNLMREIATDSNRQYFVTGSLENVEGDLSLRAKVYRSDNLQLHGEVVQTGWDLLSMIDDLSIQLKELLDVPKGGGRLDEDLPLSDTYGESLNTVETLVKALTTRLFDNDFVTADKLLAQTLEEDAGFVQGYYYKGMFQLEQGNVADAQQLFQEAQRLNYKLPAVDQAHLKALIYRFNGETERLEALLKMQVEIRGDASAYNRLAGFYMSTGEFDKAIDSYQTAFQKDSLDLGVLEKLAMLERASGDLPAAIAYAEELKEQKPESLNAVITLGDLQRDHGDLEAARNSYQRAQLLDDGAVMSYIRLAHLAARQGDWDSAKRYHDNGQAVAVTPQQHSMLLQSRVLLNFRLGRLRDAIDLIHREQEYDQQFMSPLNMAFNIYLRLAAYHLSLNELDEAERILDELDQILQPPLDQFAQLQRAALLAERQDFAGAEAAIDRMQAVVSQFKAQYLQFQVELARGSLAEEQQQYEQASVHYQEAMGLIRGSILGSDLQLLVPMTQSQVARALTLAGDYAGAQAALDEGFRLDEAEPLLWVERARQQLKSGRPELADASIKYALAIWKDADEDYQKLVDARSLAEDIRAAVN